MFIMVEALLRIPSISLSKMLYGRNILTQAEAVATKRRTMAWICMAMVLDNWMMFIK